MNASEMQGHNLVIAIDGKLIKTPREDNFKYSSYRLTKSGRVASGDMTAEIVAKKRKLFLTYETMSSKEAKLLESLVESADKFFFQVEWTMDGESNSMTAYAGEFTKTLVRPGDGTWYWKNVEVNLIEK